MKSKGYCISHVQGRALRRTVDHVVVDIRGRPGSPSDGAFLGVLRQVREGRVTDVFAPGLHGLGQTISTAAARLEALLDAGATVHLLREELVLMPGDEDAFDVVNGLREAEKFNAIFAHGLVPPRKRPGPRPRRINLESLTELAVHEGLTLERLATRFRVSERTIRRRLQLVGARTAGQRLYHWEDD